ncbi:Bug family tripartite tricarboxylate transporter substrate binding protein [Variovorax sp. PBL-E5]|uniref:Bug family tripartite tricarboxylate transporter substrate binding protein n=1 Tax=Variovorax sp. PBL-E5 TaxID=434014 RepID=UPI001316C3A1|nr:tripartite tricarboxylate transporter substrate-binding protein [Variovorax sp. PBL-E5]VTU22473.1 Argininosuccinate lyase [Variovorax sp. PBL-E5]
MISLARFVRRIAAVPMALAIAGSAFAQGYPNHPIRIVVAYPPGQSTDIATRYFASKLSAALNEGVVVENRPGAFGNMGTAYAARATPDGYTLIMGASGTHALNPALYDNTGFDAEKDFEPITATAFIPMVISVNPSLNIKSLPELIQLARSRPDKIDVALPSVTAQLVLEMIKRQNVPLFAIKYKGSGEAMTALLGNQVPVLIDTVAASQSQFGKIKPLAVTSAKPMTALPEIKSVAEQGLDGFNVVAWNALMAPRGTPVEIRDRLAAEMRKILALPETTKALHDLGFEPAPAMDHEQLVAWLRSERRTDADIIRSAHMKAD